MSQSYAILLRAVNVGGTRAVKMAEWRQVLADAGLEDPRTYVNSGNAVVRTALTAPKLAERVRADLSAKLSVDTDVMVRSQAELAAVIAGNPFPDALAAPKNLHVLFLATPISADVITQRDFDRYLPDRISAGAGVTSGAQAYLWYADGAGRSKLNGSALSALGVGTARNWNTVLTLQELMTAAG